MNEKIDFINISAFFMINKGIMFINFVTIKSVTFISPIYNALGKIYNIMIRKLSKFACMFIFVLMLFMQW